MMPAILKCSAVNSKTMTPNCTCKCDASERLLDINDRTAGIIIFMAPHRVRARSDYKDMRIRSFHHTI